MLRRPPGEERFAVGSSRRSGSGGENGKVNRHSSNPRQSRMLLALTFCALPWLSLAEAHQNQQQQHIPGPSLGRNDEASVPIANILAGAGRMIDFDEENDHHGLDNQAGYPRQQLESPLERARPVDGRLTAGNIALVSSKSTLPDAVTSVAAYDGSGGASKESRGVAVFHDLHDHDNNDKKQKYTKYTKSKGNYDANNDANNLNNHFDASALATMAPGSPVRAAKPPRQLPTVLSGRGLASPQSARSLEDWQVEDYALLATVDGDLHAVSKENGAQRWHLQVERPAVETIHHGLNNRTRKRGPGGSSSSGSSGTTNSHHPFDDWIWAVEPTRDGPIYAWTPLASGTGLVNTGLTMKSIVLELAPYAAEKPPIVYTGERKVSMISLDAATGHVLKWYGQGGSHVDDGAKCFRPRPDGLISEDVEECSHAGIITLSQTEYTVHIHRQDDGKPIATLRYTEWGPNNFDEDLHMQYVVTRDDRYVTSMHNGKLFSMDSDRKTPYDLQLSSPVARVFDVARPFDAPSGSNPELVLLPQPIPPLKNGASLRDLSSSIYLNQTETGSWYALSGLSYPMIIEAPHARVNQPNWMETMDDWTFNRGAHRVLVGTHVMEYPTDLTAQGEDRYDRAFPQLPGPQDPDGVRLPSDGFDTDSGITLASVPEYAANQAVALLTNPFLFVLVMLFGLLYIKNRKIDTRPTVHVPTLQQQTQVTTTRRNSDLTERKEPDLVSNFLASNQSAVDNHNPPKVIVTTGDEPTIGPSLGVTPQIVQNGSEAEQSSSAGQTTGAVDSPNKKKKKAHRGTRGGVRHKKAKKEQEDIENIKRLPAEPSIRPNVKSMNSNPEDVGSSGFEINGLSVNTSEQLGVGSNGTVVFSGKFHQRDVAVKRMLALFYDIAYQETSLLLESDTHPNVIQYYAFHQDELFLYIALERCHASLADIIDKPQMHPDLVQAGETDIPDFLLQIANGLSHLHRLRIVHRDLKPQNILVTKNSDGKPRLVVSDFGLCKKLDGAQSSFGATTAHAAGTSGWRAPELLLDDDVRDGSTSMNSTHSESSQLVGGDLTPNRRATRSIDIFSLGLVFFYVLTRGLHPFDFGDRYMREVNIRKGHHNLKALDALGDVAFDAKDLIQNMLNSEPRHRPTTRQVMAHPFFWGAKKRLSFLCDVSDHFEKEQRDPPSPALLKLESYAQEVCHGDFLAALPRDFVDSLGKQRKYTGSRLLDLLRGLRNKWNHRNEMSEPLKKSVGVTHEKYLGFWTTRFPNLVISCCEIVADLGLHEEVRFVEYFEPVRPK